MRILLAEDEHSLGTWLSRALEHAGIQVEWVSDGLMADRALQHADHDALVLDLGLPGLDGHGVLQRLRERDQRLPALILTARDSLDERVRLLNAGADDFLAKPFELAELEARLHALVRRARGNNTPGWPAARWFTTASASSSHCKACHWPCHRANWRCCGCWSTGDGPWARSTPARCPRSTTCCSS